MVFHQRLSAKVRAYIGYLQRESSLSYWEITPLCNISPSSAVQICHEGFRNQNSKKRMGQPPLMSRKDKGRLIRTCQKMRDDNPNVKIIDVAKECEIKNVSYRTLIRTINDARYRWLKSRRQGLLSANDRKQRVRYARAALRKIR